MSSGLIGYEPTRIIELQRRAHAVADHLLRLPGDDPLAADAVRIARIVRAHVADGWLPVLARVSASTAMTAPLELGDPGSACPVRPGTGLITAIVDAMTPEERAYLQGFVDAHAATVAGELSLLEVHPDYATDRLPEELSTLDSPADWGWLAQLYLIEQYEAMIQAGDVQVHQDGDVYWIDPLDLVDTKSEIMSEIVLAAVMFPGNLRPGGAVSEATAHSAVADPPAAREITLPRPPPHLDDPTRFDPAALDTYTYDEVVAAMDVSGWNRSPARSGGGTVYRDPSRRGRQVRVMPGYPSGARPEPATAGPYVVVSQNGVEQKVLLVGNPAR